MKTSYRITITGDRYPTAYDVQATNWATAVARGVKAWRKAFKGAKTDCLRIIAIKQKVVNPIKQAEQGKEGQI